MSDMFDQEIADVLANQEYHAESQEVKKAKTYRVKYYINIRSVNCKHLLLPTSSSSLRPYVVFKVQKKKQLQLFTKIHVILFTLTL